MKFACVKRDGCFSKPEKLDSGLLRESYLRWWGSLEIVDKSWSQIVDYNELKIDQNAVNLQRRSRHSK